MCDLLKDNLGWNPCTRSEDPKKSFFLTKYVFLLFVRLRLRSGLQTAEEADCYYSLTSSSSPFISIFDISNRILTRLISSSTKSPVCSANVNINILSSNCLHSCCRAQPEDHRHPASVSVASWLELTSYQGRNTNLETFLCISREIILGHHIISVKLCNFCAEIF